ncbi:acetolactate synthase large subunit [Sulfurivirga sp.]|uniref:acetolactate synthase large subunit n=1 Tax=Sulfurivirga sp. TaxID=2614236 RepID=UPI0025EDEC3E|nr:acetolactate synthase large subunit [Sulfurivirga sp.]
MKTAAHRLVECLVHEGVEVIFGIPGEENLRLMDALLDSPIRFVTTRHEQGAAFMADVYGRLMGRAGVCLSTLGPGATNLVTGVADANMDRAPVVAIAGQAATTRMHKESHQVLDLVSLFKPITKYSTQILEPGTVPEVVRKAFKQAQQEKPGACFIDFPENIAEEQTDCPPLPVRRELLPEAPDAHLQQAARLIAAAEKPLILAGNGVIRTGAHQALLDLSRTLNIPVVNTFMAKGVVPFFGNPLALGTAGLQAGDYENCGFSQADLVITVGFDMVEYHPHLWNPGHRLKLIHIDTTSAEVDQSYLPEVELTGHIARNLVRLAQLGIPPRQSNLHSHLREALIEEAQRLRHSDAWPLKPQKIIWDLRTAFPKEGIAVVDVGAHKMWMARMFRAEQPNTCIISNGFASMGIALPGAIAAALVHPDRPVVAVTGDAGFMMNVQELETAVRLNLNLVVLIWNDHGYGLIEWKQRRQFGRSAYTAFDNPDFVKLAESFGARGWRIDAAGQLAPVLEAALNTPGVHVIDCPVDYSENDHLVKLLGPVLTEAEE